MIHKDAMKTSRIIITAVVALLFATAFATQAEASRRNSSTPPPTVGGSDQPVVSPL